MKHGNERTYKISEQQLDVIVKICCNSNQNSHQLKLKTHLIQHLHQINLVYYIRFHFLKLFITSLLLYDYNIFYSKIKYRNNCYSIESLILELE